MARGPHPSFRLATLDLAVLLLRYRFFVNIISLIEHWAVHCRNPTSGPPRMSWPATRLGMHTPQLNVLGESFSPPLRRVQICFVDEGVRASWICCRFAPLAPTKISLGLPLCIARANFPLCAVLYEFLKAHGLNLDLNHENFGERLARP